MKGRQRPLSPEFTFAGFTFPRYLATLPAGSKKDRQERYKYTGGYYTAPKPEPSTSHGFYLDDSTRYRWADDVDSSIEHTGWFCDEYQDGKIRGIVVLLPHGRCLAGWSMGEGMASMVETDTVYDDQEEAAQMADYAARYAAERELEYQAEHRDEDEN